MDKTIPLFLIALFLVIIGLSMSSMGFFSAELSRDSQIRVTADTESIIQMKPSPTYGIVEINPDGELVISPRNVNADSINQNMQLQIGSRQPQSDHAFTITSLADKPAVLNLTIEQRQEYASTADSVTYIVQKGNNSPKTLTANNQTTTFVLNPTDTLYVSVEIDTSGELAGNLNTNLVIESDTQ